MKAVNAKLQTIYWCFEPPSLVCSKEGEGGGSHLAKVEGRGVQRSLRVEVMVRGGGKLAMVVTVFKASVPALNSLTARKTAD